MSGHHELRAIGIGERASLDPPKSKRERKPRDKTLVKRTEKATGRRVSGITYLPDGSRKLEVGKPEREPEGDLNLAGWRNRHAR